MIPKSRKYIQTLDCCEKNNFYELNWKNRVKTIESLGPTLQLNLNCCTTGLYKADKLVDRKSVV